MSLGQCIPGMIERGEISQQQGEDMALLFDDLQRSYKRQMGEQAAAAMASEETLKRLAIDAAEKRRRQLLQVQAQRQAWLDMGKYGTGAGGVRVLDPARPKHRGEAAGALLVRSEYAPYMNVEYQLRAIRGQAQSTLDQLLSKHHRNLRGQVRDKAGIEDIVRERFAPGSTGNASAKAIAEAMEEVFEGLRLRRNAAGGRTGRLERWAMPQSHDAQAVADAGYGAWRDFILPLLDRERMIDQRTGQPFSPEALELALRDVHETIASDGWNARSPGGAGRPSLANQRADHRFLQFADADSWMAYQERFGGRQSPFDVIMGHIDGMARDIALMERLGPNPEATMRWLGDMIEKEANLDGSKKMREAASAARSTLQSYYDQLSGKLNQPHNRARAKIFSTVRSLQVASKLGSAVLSTTSDTATQILARRYNGLPVLRGAMTQLKQLNPASAADREMAVRLGMIAEDWAQMSSAQGRLLGEELTSERARVLAEGVLRVSGMNAVTQSGRSAFWLDALAHITDQRDTTWQQLDAPFRSMMERYGLTEGNWDTLRATELEEDGGARWIKPQNITDGRLRDTVMRMINTEMDFAVPVPGVAVQAAMNSAARPGTWVGEILRTGLQFKSFPMTIMAMQFQRIMAQRGFNRATYAAQMIIFTTVAGAIALQLKEIAKGRDPRPMADEKGKPDGAFWAAALFQGGGAGIYGDFFKSSTSRFGGGLADTLAGPAFQTVDSVTQAALIQPGKAVLGMDSNVGRATLRVIKSEVPGMSLWFGRLAFERLMLDELQQQIDPNYRDAWRRLDRYAEEQGTEYFWAPGDVISEARAPDVGNMVSEAQ